MVSLSHKIEGEVNSYLNYFFRKFKVLSHDRALEVLLKSKVKITLLCRVVSVNV